MKSEIVTNGIDHIIAQACAEAFAGWMVDENIGRRIETACLAVAKAVVEEIREECDAFVQDYIRHPEAAEALRRFRDRALAAPVAAKEK